MKVFVALQVHQPQRHTYTGPISEPPLHISNSRHAPLKFPAPYPTNDHQRFLLHFPFPLSTQSIILRGSSITVPFFLPPFPPPRRTTILFTMATPQPSSPPPRTSKPVSEALLNDKVLPPLSVCSSSVVISSPLTH